ncbi:MAG: hypothetical protein HY341_01430, partial [Candidatus Kerfeldbacteria bacterium]|nr:hypothetical protein [Candidatus Kerfeldbacteria bacterium]
SFRKSLRLGEKLIRERGVLVDIGVLPTWPNEHLGYTHIGQQVLEDDGIAVFSFRGHTEKPDRATAQSLIASGEYLWHANYYMWTPRKFLDAYAQYAPETHGILRRIQDLVAAGNETAIAAAYAELEPVSIDYAITEKLDPSKVLIIRSPFDWNDVGMWSQLKSLQASERKANVVNGAMHVGIDTTDTLVMGDPQKLIATVGVENLVIVDTGDVLLVCRKDRDQDVKRLLALLKEKGYERYL